jgi:two-component system, OmpR family, alkaline phosphatase synthesis response regulator PhoP
MSARLERVRVPNTYPREKSLLGELHLIRSRLERMLTEVAEELRTSDQEERWERVEQAARLARRAVVAAVAAMPPVPAHNAPASELRVGELRVDTVGRRQWYGEAEFELTPLHHALLATMAAEPTRVFGRDELERAVWRRASGRESCAVKIAVSKLRRALVGAGAPPERFLVSLHGVGWALVQRTSRSLDVD